MTEGDARLEGAHLVYLASLDDPQVMGRAVGSIVQKVAEGSMADGRPIDWSTLSITVEPDSSGHPRIHVKAWGVRGEPHWKPSDVLARSMEGVMRKLWRERAPRKRPEPPSPRRGRYRGEVDG